MTFNKIHALQEAQRTLAQGKLSQAIREYLAIIENDPSDLSLLNTVGDLCVRDNNLTEAMRLFRRLAEAYVREGFILRAIAIYKKIIKLDSNAIEPLLKLAELYADQSLPREARDLYAQALALCQRDNQKERAIEVMRKMVSSEPANKAHLLRLAECCLAVGRREEALKAYLDGAESALGEGDTSSATVALDQAAAIDPQAPRLADLRRRLSPEAVAEPFSPEAAAEGAGIAQAIGVPQAEEQPVEGLPPEPGAAAGLAAVEAAPEAPAVEQVTEPAAVVQTPEQAAVEEVPEQAVPLETVAPAPLREPDEFDLSGEWESVAASQVALAEAAPPALDIEEAAAEIDFYVNYGLTEEARKSVARLEEKFPGDPQVAELRRRLEAPAAAEIVEMPEAPAAAEVVESSEAPVAIVPNPLEDLARHLESSWGGVEAAIERPAPPSVPSAPVTMPDFAVSLGALLGELGSEPSEVSGDDSQTHYQLGVAFREMGLIEEAIGEFQKVVRTVRRGTYPPQYLAACSLLGLCFTERQLPRLAINWYTRALECPNLDPEAAIALEYDLGAAFEQAGDLEAAREKFLQVYSQNVDYRDVADKIRQLAGKS
jgi:tetratricopeptide (TPR) repeat protein